MGRRGFEPRTRGAVPHEYSTFVLSDSWLIAVSKLSGFTEKTMVELYDTTPQEAVNEYLDDRATEDISNSTLQSHGYRLKHFVRWADEEGIENMNNLNGRDLQKYRRWRKHDGNLNNVTWHTQMTTFRVFINWCENYQAVTPDLSQKVRVPELSQGEDQREEFLGDERALELIDHLHKYQYASVQHAVFYLMWRIGARVGGVHALDVGDYNSEEQVLEIRHRPESGTPLKNGEKGERDVFLEGKTCKILDDYIEDVREDQRDEAGRRPLFTTTRGRAHQSTLRDWIYRLTRPCTYGDCPHDRDPDDCEATESWGAASKCPSSVNPHMVRKGSITYWLNRDVPEEQIGQRANVQPDVLELHYDKRTKREKMSQRKDYFARE